MTERQAALIEVLSESPSTDPVELFERVAASGSVAMHGPEHHFIDGACVLAAYAAAGGEVDLPTAFERLSERSSLMPGAMCAHWGVCGAAASVGAALSIIEGAGPLSAGRSWGGHIGCVSRALARMAEIGGPRCCKRNAYIALEEACAYLRQSRGVDVGFPGRDIVCSHSAENRQCLGGGCPFSAGA